MNFAQLSKDFNINYNLTACIKITGDLLTFYVAGRQSVRFVCNFAIQWPNNYSRIRCRSSLTVHTSLERQRSYEW